MAGTVMAKFVFSGEEVFQASVPSGGPVSENIKAMKEKTMAYMTDFLKTHNMKVEEIDMLEEQVSEGEDEEESKGKGRKGKKRKR